MESVLNRCPICIKSTANSPSASAPAGPAPSATPSAADICRERHKQGIAAFRSGSFERAAAVWTALLTDGTLPDDNRQRAFWYSCRAASHLPAGAMADAELDCEQALAMDASCILAAHIRELSRAKCSGNEQTQPATLQPPAAVAVLITDSPVSSEVSLEGVTPLYLRTFIEHCGGRSALAGMSCSDVKRRFLLPLTELHHQSVARVLLHDYAPIGGAACSLAAARANVFISHVWNPPQCDVCRARFNRSERRPLLSANCDHTACAACWAKVLPMNEIQLLQVHQDEWDAVASGSESTFLDTVDAILTHCDALPPLQQASTVLYMDLFSVCQHEQIVVRPSSWWLNTFKESISNIGSVLMVLSPWENPRALQRTWCVLELFLCNSTNGTFNVAVSASERQKFLDDIQDPRKFYRMLSRVQVERSNCGKPKDRADILGAVKDHVGFDNLDSAVLRQLEAWMLATLSKEATSALNVGNTAAAAAFSFALANLRSDMSFS